MSGGAGRAKLCQAKGVALRTSLLEVPRLLYLLHTSCSESEVAFTGMQGTLTSGLLGFVLQIW